MDNPGNAAAPFRPWTSELDRLGIFHSFWPQHHDRVGGRARPSNPVLNQRLCLRFGRRNHDVHRRCSRQQYRQLHNDVDRAGPDVPFVTAFGGCPGWCRNANRDVSSNALLGSRCHCADIGCSQHRHTLPSEPEVACYLSGVDRKIMSRILTSDLQVDNPIDHARPPPPTGAQDS